VGHTFEHDQFGELNVSFDAIDPHSGLWSSDRVHELKVAPLKFHDSFEECAAGGWSDPVEFLPPLAVWPPGSPMPHEPWGPFRHRVSGDPVEVTSIDGGYRLTARDARHWHDLVDDPGAFEGRFPIRLHLRGRLAGGVALTFGQILGLAGDFVGTFEELECLTRAGLKAVRWAATRRSMRLLVGSEDRLKLRALRRFWELAYDNFDHFNSEREAGVGPAQRRFEADMKRALVAARAAYESRSVAAAQRLYHQAIARCAFACHFLTDCFSAGHLRVPRRALYDECARLFGRKKTRLDLVLGALYPETARHRWMRDTLLPFQVEDAQLMAGTYANMMHDLENKLGLWVRVGERDVFRAYGDGYYDKGCAQQRLARRAVHQAAMAVFQTRFWGYSDYQPGVAPSAACWEEHDPTGYIPTPVEGRNPRALISVGAGGALGGALWEKTRPHRMDCLRSDAALLDILFALRTEWEAFVWSLPEPPKEG